MQFAPPQTHTHLCIQKAQLSWHTRKPANKHARTQIPSWYSTLSVSLYHKHTHTHTHSWRLLPLKNAHVQIKRRISHAHAKIQYRHVHIHKHTYACAASNTPETCMRLLTKPSHHTTLFFKHTHCLSLAHTHTHTHTHADADVTRLAWSTVHDRLDLAAPEMDRQSGYCSAGMIQCMGRTTSNRKQEAHTLNTLNKVRSAIRMSYHTLLWSFRFQT